MMLILWISMHCMIIIEAETKHSVPSMVADDHEKNVFFNRLIKHVNKSQEYAKIPLMHIARGTKPFQKSDQLFAKFLALTLRAATQFNQVTVFSIENKQIYITHL